MQYQLRKPRGTTVIAANSVTLTKCSSASNLRVKSSRDQDAKQLKAAKSSERSTLNQLNGVSLGDFKLSTHLMRKAGVKTPRDIFKNKAAQVIANNHKVKLQKIQQKVANAVRVKSRKATSSQSNDSGKTVEFEYSQDIVKVAPKKMLQTKRSISRKASTSSSGACAVGDEGHAGQAKVSEVAQTATIKTAGQGYQAMGASGSMTLTTSRSSAGLSLTGSGVQNTSLGAGANPQEDRFYSTFNIAQRPITITQAFNSPEPESSDEPKGRKMTEQVEDPPKSKVAQRLNKIQFTLAQKMQGLEKNPVKIGKQGNETSRNKKGEPFFLPSREYSLAVPQKKNKPGVTSGAYVTARHSHKNSFMGTNDLSSLMGGQTPSLQRCLKKKSSKAKQSTSLQKVCSMTRLGNKTSLNLRSGTGRALSVSQKAIDQLGQQPTLKRTLQPQQKKPSKRASSKASQSIQLVKTTVSPSKKCRKTKDQAVKVQEDQVTFKPVTSVLTSRPSEDDKPAKTKLTQIRVIRQKDSHISIEQTSPRQAEETTFEPVFQIAKDSGPGSTDAALKNRSNSQGKSTLSYTPSIDLSADLPRCLRDNVFPLQKKPSIESIGKTSFSDMARAMNREETIPDQVEQPLKTQVEQDLEEQSLEGSHRVGSYINMFIQNNNAHAKQNLLQGSTTSQDGAEHNQLLQSFLTADQKSALTRRDNRSSTFFKPTQHLTDSKKKSRDRTKSGGLQSGGTSGPSQEDPICTLSEGESSDSIRQSFPKSSSKIYDQTLKSLHSDTRYSLLMPQTTEAQRYNGLTSITPDQPSLQDLQSPSTGESYIMRRKKMLELQMHQFDTVEEEKISDFNTLMHVKEPLEVQVLQTDEDFAQLEEIDINQNWASDMPIPRVIACSDSSESDSDFQQ